MNEILYILKFKYDVIFGQSYELVPMPATNVDVKQILDARTLGNMKVMQRTNNGKNR